MQTRLVTTLGLIVALTAACAAPAGESTPGASGATAEPTPTASEPGELALPDDVTLSWIGDFEPVTGEAHFNELAEDQFSISIEVESTAAAAATDFSVLLLGGTCADQSEPADFQAALDVQTFEAGETPAFLLSRDELDEILGSPHSILVTDGPGLNNLACGEIEG